MDQDVPMADAPTARQKPGEEKRSPRKSELQNYVSPKSVLDKVLNTPVTVAVGELLAVSKEVSHQVQEVIKLKSSKGPEAKPATQYVDTGKDLEEDPLLAAAAFTPRTKGQLIKLRMECDGTPITAIIDTGSQLNIAHKQLWLNALSRPMDVTKRITMGDANGGEGVLHTSRSERTP